VGHWGFPANLQWWWALFGLPAVPAMIGGLVTFLRDAPWWGVLLVVFVSYLLALIIARFVLSYRQTIRLTTHPRPTDKPIALTSDKLQARVEEPQDEGTSPRPDELGALCLHLSEELREFIRRRQTSSEGAMWFDKSRNAETELERKKAKIEEWKAMPRDRERTLELYQERYQERAMTIYETLAKRAWLGPNQRHYFEAPDHNVEIQQAARILEDVGNKLRESGS
jgi:hypothetical protein